MEFWEWFMEYILPNVSTGLIASLIGIAFTYFFGRMTGIVNSDRGRCSLFTVVSALSVWVYIYLYGEHPSSILEWGWLIIYHTGIAVIIFTLGWMKMYSRLDKLQDSKIAEDD